MHQHITCDVIRSFLEDNDNALRPDEGKDFIEFAKELMEKHYEKGKIGFSTCKNYNPQNEMLAFCKTKCSIRKTKRILLRIPS